MVGSPLTNEFYVRAPKGNCYSTPLDPKHVNLRRLNYRSPFPNLYYVGASSCLPGFATIIHFACMLYEELTGDRVSRIPLAHRVGAGRAVIQAAGNT